MDGAWGGHHVEQLISRLLRDFEEGKMNRRQLVKSLAVAAAAGGTAPRAKAAGGFKAVTVNHISYQVADYARTRDFYADLLGMGVKGDTGRQCNMTFGNSFLLPRNMRAGSDRKPPLVDHIAYTIEGWDKDRVKAELDRRGLNPRPDTEDSFHVKDPDGFDLQISGENMKA
jgi:catechol 2,3-dioxygenase-like lactoylglutathione lyase family enzyme